VSLETSAAFMRLYLKLSRASKATKALGGTH
jgi:hypothetical protein